MLFADHLTLDAPRPMQGGFVAYRAKAARTGVYQYGGSEVDPDNKHGLRDTAVVHVLRDERTVFDQKAVHSFIGKPITDDHPNVAVTSDNHRQLARGTVMGAMREGDYLAFDLLLTDAEAIRKVGGGKRELSNGYSAELEFGDFTAADGTKCQARQTSISGNHVALVDRGRAGPECAIKDGFALCDSLPSHIFDSLKEKPVKKITLDGLQVDLSDADAVAAAISKLQDKASTAETALATAQTAHDKALAAKDKEIDDLKSKVVDQSKIDALADEKAAVVADAKAIAGAKLGDTKGKTVSEVRRMALDAAGIVTTDKSDDYVEARFDGLKDAKPSDPIRDALKGGLTTADTNIANIRDAARAASNR